MADDYSSTISTTGKLSVGRSASGEFETSYDSDWFKISLKAGTTYIFTLSGSATGDGTLNTLERISLNLYDGKGSYASGGLYTSSSSTGATLQFTAQTTGDYFVSANGSVGSGTYTLRAATPAADDYSNNVNTAGRLQQGVATSAVFERAEDVDWFKFRAEKGQIIVFDAGGIAGGQYKAGRTVYDASGAWVGYLTDGPFIASKSGDYYLAVSAGSRIGAYTQTMQVATDDYAADSTSTGRIYSGSQAYGTIDYYGDSDRFQMSMEAGQVYTLTLRVPGATSPSPLSMWVTGPSGDFSAVSASYPAENGALTLRYLATGSGTFGINISGSVDTRPSYVVTASYGETDDHGGTRDTATAVPLDTPMSGVLQSSRDIDMFKIELKAGVTYNISYGDMTSTQLSSQLTDSNGNSLASIGYNTKGYNYTPYKDGTYYIATSNYSSSNTPYTLTVSTPEDDYTASVTGAGRLLVGGSAKGTMGAGGADRDWFSVSLAADGYYWFKLEGSKDGGGTLPYYSYSVLKLYDSSGKELASTPSNISDSPVLAFKAPQRGSYYLEVSSSSSTATGTYTVKAQLGTPDDYGNDAAHAAVILDGVPLKGSLELVADKDVFKLSAVAGMTYLVEITPDKATSNWSYATSFSVNAGTSSNYISFRTSQVNSKTYGVFEATKGGDYYMTLAASSSYNVTGGYTMSVRAAGMDDYSANASTTAFIEPSKAVQGALHVGDDVDWIKVHLDAGRTYVFDLQGKYSGGGTLDTSLASFSLVNANGSNVASHSLPATSAGSDPRIQYVANATGDYYLSVRNNYSSNTSTGTYTVKEVQTNLDTVGPQLLSSSVAAGASNVSPLTKITLTFNETVMLGNGITLTDSLGTKVSGTASVQATVAGSVITFDPHAKLIPGMQYTLNLQPGSVVDLSGNPAAATQSFSFTVKAPVSTGTAGNDYLLGSGGTALDGGAGIDTVFYTNSSYRYSYQREADGSIEVRSYDNYDTVQKLTGIERLMFTDYAFAMDIDGIGGQAYRMYQSAFNRRPDSAGVGFWMDHMEKGMSLQEVASRFIASTEFTNTYGAAPSDADFVTLLYRNVLHREPEAAGKAHWLEQLGNGQSRAQVLVGFSESAENHDNVATLIGNGFLYTPYGG
ncbi:DUF4214 domain-containing protein [Duganella sp. sic0402]|uniref:DUF4214 domain-containing protein n=1 Tax=Duganella sp. sic0402 TaxID=2854786 RepID=UPI001C475226|nr:DUF4214 domain-containing protein [Duganella sp. sic0402]MBV7539256.1 DUF4214 domain-containing protein [Duganella sp. sic0402]